MSTNERNYVNKIVASYSEKEKNKLDELKSLDKKVKNPVNIFAYVFGTLGSLVMGFGMCVAMEVIMEGNMFFGIIVGLVGIFLVTINYFMYKKMLDGRKRKYSDRILALSNEILNN